MGFCIRVLIRLVNSEHDFCEKALDLILMALAVQHHRVVLRLARSIAPLYLAE